MKKSMLSVALLAGLPHHSVTQSYALAASNPAMNHGHVPAKRGKFKRRNKGSKK